MTIPSVVPNFSGSQQRKLSDLENGVREQIAALDKDGRKRLFDNVSVLASRFAAEIDRLSAKQPDYSRAREILGDDFISPEEILKVYPDLGSNDMSELPSEDDLRWLKANGYLLVARPHLYLSLLDIRQLDSSLFYSKTGSWYEEQKFAKDDRTGNCAGWLAIKKTPVNGSINKNWTEQNKLLSEVEIVPNAAEFAWAVTIYYKVRGVYLFQGIYCRTSSVDSGGFRVGLGSFDAGGLRVSSYWGFRRYSNLGLASSRKF